MLGTIDRRWWFVTLCHDGSRVRETCYRSRAFLRVPRTCHRSRGCLGVLRGLGSGLRGAQVAVEAGLQPFDEGLVAEGQAVAPLDDMMRDARSDAPCQSCQRRRFTVSRAKVKSVKCPRNPRHGRRTDHRLTILRIADHSGRESAFPQIWPARPLAADYRRGWRKPTRLTRSGLCRRRMRQSAPRFPCCLGIIWP
jgi:hypothetical protein